MFFGGLKEKEKPVWGKKSKSKRKKI